MNELTMIDNQTIQNKIFTIGDTQVMIDIEEIKEVLDFTAKLFDRVCGILEIDKGELV
jgi:hypothetical protein